MIKSQRQQQKENTRKLIIDVALIQFTKDGLIAARTSDIASAAKVSHGTVFAHFPTREILLDSVVEEFGMRITTRLHELVSENCRLSEVLKAHLKGISEYEGFYTRLVTEGRSLNESSRNSLIMIHSAISFHISQVAEREIIAGKVRPIPIALLYNTWVGLVHHYLVNSDLFAPEGRVLEKYGNELIEHYLSLINK